MAVEVTLVSVMFSVVLKFLLKVMVGVPGGVVGFVYHVCLRVMEVVPRLILLFLMCFKTTGRLKVGLSNRATTIVMFAF